MRSVEDMLLQLILQGDSFTYHFAASHHHVVHHRDAPCFTHHTIFDLMTMFYTSYYYTLGCIVVPCVITMLSYNMTHVLATPCLPLLSMLSILSMLHHAPLLPCNSCPMYLYSTMYLSIPCIYTTLCTLMSHASIQHYLPRYLMHIYNTVYLVVPCIYTTLCFF